MQSLKQALTDAGIELYGEDEATLRIAERHRYHLMDSGVEARMRAGAVEVRFCVRAQRSDFPHVEVPRIFERIRSAVGDAVAERGFVGNGERVVEVNDPVDNAKLLDVWYELDYGKHVESTDDAVDEIRWALTIDKYVRPG